MACMLRSRPSLKTFAAPYSVSFAYGWWASLVGKVSASP